MENKFVVIGYVCNKCGAAAEQVPQGNWFKCSNPKCDCQSATWVDNRQEIAMKSWMQHNFNPVHVYCRLVGILGKKAAKVIAKRYEIHVWHLLYN